MLFIENEYYSDNLIRQYPFHIHVDSASQYLVVALIEVIKIGGGAAGGGGGGRGPVGAGGYTDFHSF